MTPPPSPRAFNRLQTSCPIGAVRPVAAPLPAPAPAAPSARGARGHRLVLPQQELGTAPGHSRLQALAGPATATGGGRAGARDPRARRLEICTRRRSQRWRMRASVRRLSRRAPRRRPACSSHGARTPGASNSGATWHRRRLHRRQWCARVRPRAVFHSSAGRLAHRRPVPAKGGGRRRRDRKVLAPRACALMHRVSNGAECVPRARWRLGTKLCPRPLAVAAKRGATSGCH